jgi:excisionase family DNA binding protein
MNDAATPYELTVGPAAKLLGTSEASVRRMVDRGDLLARFSPGGHRLIPREAVAAMQLRRQNPGDPLGSGVARNGDRPSAGNVERRERRAATCGGDLDGGDRLTPDEAREEGRRDGLRLVQQYGDRRWLREQHSAELRDMEAHPERYAGLGDLLELAEWSSEPWEPWPPLVQDEVFRRVAARIERVVFHGIAREQVRRAVRDVVLDCWNRFQCPEPGCGGPDRLACEPGCGCELCEGV